MKVYDVVVPVKSNRRITDHLYVLGFESKELARSIEPGQFLQIAVSENHDPFLRRPFTVYRHAGNTLEILYEVVGKGTGILSRKRKGDTLKIMGPLGNTFRMNQKNTLRITVGGGVGIAPFVFLGQRVKIDHFLMGARSKSRLLPKSEVKGLWPKTECTTDDGSFGMRGLITKPLERLIQDNGKKKVFIYTCGPTPMMRAVIQIAKKYGVDGEVSVEERMGCGVGACLGCVVSTVHGNKPSCKEGTVFSFNEILL